MRKLAIAMTLCSALTLQADDRYDRLLESIKHQQSKFSEMYARSSPDDQKRIIKEVRVFMLETYRKKIFPAWKGTKYSPGGKTKKPRTGTIACGHFAVRVVQALGFNMPEVGNESSETIMKAFGETPLVGRRVAYTSAVQYLHLNKPGLYITGMRTHTGVTYGATVPQLTHANNPAGVIRQNLEDHPQFRHYPYRSVARIDSDSAIRKWLGYDRSK